MNRETARQRQARIDREREQARQQASPAALIVTLILMAALAAGVVIWRGQVEAHRAHLPACTATNSYDCRTLP